MLLALPETAPSNPGSAESGVETRGSSASAERLFTVLCRMWCRWNKQGFRPEQAVLPHGQAGPAATLPESWFYPFPQLHYLRILFRRAPAAAWRGRAECRKTGPPERADPAPENGRWRPAILRSNSPAAFQAGPDLAHCPEQSPNLPPAGIKSGFAAGAGAHVSTASTSRGASKRGGSIEERS